MCVLACPHCDSVIEVLGEVRSLQCDCGGEMDVCDPVDDLAAAELDRLAPFVREHW